MGLDFQESVEDGQKVWAFVQEVRAFAASLKVAEGEPAKSISYVTEGVGKLIASAGKLADAIKADVQD